MKCSRDPVAFVLEQMYLEMLSKGTDHACGLVELYVGCKDWGLALSLAMCIELDRIKRETIRGSWDTHGEKRKLLDSWFFSAGAAMIDHLEQQKRQVEAATARSAKPTATPKTERFFSRRFSLIVSC